MGAMGKVTLPDNSIKAPEVLSGLKHTLLIATSELNGSFFERAVIYMCRHDTDGAMGVVVNKPFNKISFGDITKSMGIEDMMAARAAEQPIILRGGPVENNRGFVLHSSDYHIGSTQDVGPNVGLSATADIVSDIAKGKGPSKLNFCLGYAGWNKGQLEDELHTSSWLVVPADPEILFNVPADQRYAAATRKLGLNVLNFHDMVGQA